MINKKMLLKYIITPFLVILALTSCTSTPRSTKMQVANAVEVMGINWAQHQGRILRIESKGNEFTEPEIVRENALIRATWEVHQLGLEYFIILSENGRVTHSSFSGASTSIGRSSETARGSATFGRYTQISLGMDQPSITHSLVIIIFGCSESELVNDVPTFAVNTRLEKAKKYFSAN